MRIQNAKAWLSRRFSALMLTALLPLSALPAAAQHDQHAGHDMSNQPKPNVKSTTKRKSAPKKASARRRPAQQASTPTPTASPTGQQTNIHSGHDMSPSTAPTPDPHQGHVMPQASPTPAPAAVGQQPTGGHDQHQMPAPSPTPTPMQQPGQTVDHSGHQMPTTPAPQSLLGAEDDLPSGPVMRLEDLERMAVESNPTVAQAESAIRAAQGRRRQAGLFPNPVIGYFGEELVFRAARQTSEHGVFVEQTIPLGGKLGKAKRVFAREAEQAEAGAQAQRQRVLNAVRMLYLDALAAQRLVELRGSLARLSREAVDITKELYNVGQADRPDQLEIEIEAERADIELLRARNDREAVWQVLGAMVGNPQLQPARLAGSLEEEAVSLDQQQLIATLLSDSPELKIAQAGVERARAVLARARAERIPDLFLRGGVGYNNELLEEDRKKKGAEGRIEVGINVPIFNRNQGGIAAAEAELGIAEREQQRLQLLLRSRFASSFREYRNAQQTVEKYRTQVVPMARQAYEMYLSNFRQMAASYPQVLIAQRTLFQVEVEYARAITELRRTAVGLRGFLLSGGLDAPGTGERGGEGTGGFMLRSASDASGDSDNR